MCLESATREHFPQPTLLCLVFWPTTKIFLAKTYTMGFYAAETSQLWLQLLSVDDHLDDYHKIMTEPECLAWSWVLFFEPLRRSILALFWHSLVPLTLVTVIVKDLCIPHWRKPDSLFIYPHLLTLTRGREFMQYYCVQRLRSSHQIQLRLLNQKSHGW